MKQYEAHDGDRTFVFTGELLGEATSFTVGKTRWTEARIYRTRTKNYIVEIVGRTKITGEHDRSRAQVCATARGAVESLYMLDDDQVRYIPRVNKEAAIDAAALDETFSQAFYVEEVA